MPMKRYFFLILAVLTMTAVLLTGCQKSETEDNTPTIESYDGYGNIPDLGQIAGAESDTDKATAAAERLSVDAESIFVYSLGDVTEDSIKTWTKELNSRGFEKNGTLTEDGNTVTWYSEDRQIGVVAGYTENTFNVFLVGKSLASKYVNLDYDSVQRAWGNANNGASFFIDSKKIYGYGYIGSASDGFLSKYTDSSDALMLVEGEKPTYVHEWDNVVYACLSDRMVAVDTKEKDAEEAVTTLVEAKLNSLQIVNEKLYYTRGNGLYSCDLEGENTLKITDTKMKDAYVVGDKVYYRSEEDGNTEHVYSLLTEVDTRITDEAVSSFFLGSKGNAYYIAERDIVEEEVEDTADEESSDEEVVSEESEEVLGEETTDEEEPTTYWALIRYSLNDDEKTELASVREGTALVAIEKKIYFIEEHDGQIFSVSKSGSEPKRVVRDEDCKYLMSFHDMLLYYDFDDETEDGLEHIYISTPDGFMKSDILY